MAGFNLHIFFLFKIYLIKLTEVGLFKLDLILGLSRLLTGDWLKVWLLTNYLDIRRDYLAFKVLRW